MNQNHAPTRWMIAAIMLALCIWGAYLAAGAYLLNMDPRKAYIVMGCVAAFLGLWALVIAGLARKRGLAAQEQLASAATSPADGWNSACVVSTVIAAGGWLAVVLASTRTFASRYDMTLAVVLLVCLFGSLVSGLVGLSHRHHARGKTLCMIGLISLPVLCVVATLAWPQAH